MRFKEITEVSTNTQRGIKNISYPQLDKFIAKNCMPWINATDGGAHVVYRGVKDALKLRSFVKKTRTDRYASDTEDLRHKLFNIILSHVGSVANRTNSVFCTGAMSEAADYGKPYVLIPIGDFSFSWSPIYYDWTREFDYHKIIAALKPGIFSYSDKANNQVWNHPPTAFHLLDLAKDPKNFKPGALENIITVNKNLIEAINSNHEIMIKCDSALYVDIPDWRKLQIGASK